MANAACSADGCVGLACTCPGLSTRAPLPSRACLPRSPVLPFVLWSARFAMSRSARGTGACVVQDATYGTSVSGRQPQLVVLTGSPGLQS